MTPEEWRRVRLVLETALDLDPASRSRFLESADLEPPLRLEVELMIDLHEQAGSKLLNAPAFVDVFGDNPSEVRREKRIGPYEIQDEIGHGGMGAVYRAKRADGQFDQEVALKIVHGGIGALAVARFRNERQILAGLDHPNIAKLFDGGTTADGLPYFVMEFIDGLPIADYCERKELSVEARLRLFLAVCSAVHYAHQHLLIHRDIKPSNILITKNGVPKLLDFGIAKVLGPPLQSSDTARTVEGRWMMTPEYASPEQVQGRTVTTGTDVYSLGLVLYEILTGRHALIVNEFAPHEIARAICDDEPEKPSVAVRSTNSARPAKRLKGDLDNIILMALRKEPARRYASVEQFAEDLRRYLRHEPVIARDDTPWYRAVRFFTRHKSAVAATAVLAATILAGLGATLYEAHIARQQAETARQQRARAERRFNDVRALANSLMFEIHDSIKDLPGAIPARKLLVERALQYLDSLSQESAGDASLQRELAAAYDRVGDLQGNTGAANIGDWAGALKSYSKALAIRKTSARSTPNDAQVQADLLNDYFRMSFVLQDYGNYDEAVRDLDEGIVAAQKLAEAQSDPQYQELLAGFYWKKGNVLSARNDHAGALAAFRQSLSIRKPIAFLPGANPMYRTHLGGDYLGVAKELHWTGDNAQAAQYAKAAIESFEPIVGANPQNATFLEYLAEMYDQSAPIFEDHGELDSALSYSERSVHIFAKLSSANPSDQLAGDNVALSQLDLGAMLLRHSQAEQAIPHFRTAVADFEALQHKNRYDVNGLIDADFKLGQAFAAVAEGDSLLTMKRENLLAARSWFEKSLRSSLGPTLADTAYSFHSRGEIEQAIARCAAALAKLRNADSSAQLALHSETKQ
jgi:eukaryotic-like serine/threonine-protein kinase